MSGCLFVVSTPIGNLGDISRRALEVLASVDLVAAEDTRRSIQLMRHFGISTPLISYHEHSSMDKHSHILDLLSSGKRVALISDAGTPGIADPGEGLIKDWIQRGGEVTVVPGPVAAISALLLSGLPTGRFAFEGFLPRGRKVRRSVLQELSTERRTIIFYEAPHRILETLEDMLLIFGDRRAAIARELTKLFEQTLRGSLSELVEIARAGKLKGEIVLVVEGSSEQLPASEEVLSPEELLSTLLKAGLPPAKAAKTVSERLKIPRSEAYNIAVGIKTKTSLTEEEQ